MRNLAINANRAPCGTLLVRIGEYSDEYVMLLDQHITECDFVTEPNPIGRKERKGRLWRAVPKYYLGAMEESFIGKADVGIRFRRNGQRKRTTSGSVESLVA